MKKVRYTIYIDEKMRKRLTEMANNVGVSTNVIAYWAIKEYIGEDEQNAYLTLMKGIAKHGRE